ncbi:hypothetical protein AK830_g2078 [Neonectria ditissima]|uniref:Uncharacterized protein n=1 Tax=Neonectria ditissima TaxID=78410 RepID=A0A0N8H8G1_9HYPO|nr:hypothetical protein AK830_g2078 [Neonectria ditissima]
MASATPTSAPESTAPESTSPEPAALEPSAQGRADDWIDSNSHFLRSPWPFNKTPSRLERLIDTTITSPEDSTTRISFLYGGFQVWLACACNTASPSPSNAQFDKLSLRVRALAAGKVAEVVPHLTIKTAMLQMENKRRKLADGIRISPSSNTEPPYSATLTTNQIHSGPVVESVLNPTTDCDASSRLQTLENASVDGIGQLLPDFMASAILRNVNSDVTAKVKMIFPVVFAERSSCQMILTVGRTHVEHFVRSLYGIHVELTGQGREIVDMAGGGRIGALSNFVLRRADAGVIEQEFGTTVATAFEQSEDRKFEVLMGSRRRTRLLEMNIPGEYLEADITIWLDARLGTQIRHMLYNK